MNRPQIGDQLLYNGQPAVIWSLEPRPNGALTHAHVILFVAPTHTPTASSIRWRLHWYTALWFAPTADYRDATGQRLDIVPNEESPTYIETAAWRSAVASHQSLAISTEPARPRGWHNPIQPYIARG